MQFVVIKGFFVMKYRIFSVLLLWMFSFICYSAKAETLLNVYQLAQKNDPTFLSQMHMAEATSENYKQARALLFPTVNFRYAQTDTSQNIISADNEVFAAGKVQFPTTEYELTVSQPIYNRPYWLRFKQSKIELKKIAAEMEVAKQNLIYKVIERYFTALRYQEETKGFDAEIKGLKRQYELVQTELESGLNKKTAMKKAQAAYLDAQARKEDSQYKLDDALAGLEEITGKSITSLSALKVGVGALAKPKPASEKVWVKNAQKDNPLIFVQENALKMANQELKAQKAERHPTFDLVFTQDSTEKLGTLFGGGSNIENTKMMLELNVPLYSGGSVSSKIRKSRSLVKKSDSDLTALKRSIKREVLKAFNSVNASLFKINALSKLVSASQEDWNARKQAAESGIISNIQMVDAERALAKARTKQSVAKYDYILNIMKLKWAAGGLSEKDLSALMGKFLGQNIKIK